MAKEPFSIIKPDATRRNLTGQINSRLEAAVACGLLARSASN